jgi:radical SAM protein with 4Fe4S-binding SPASM domain
MNRHLEISTTAGCKVSCSYCPQELFALEHKKVSNDRWLSFDTFKQCLKTVPLDVDIHFSGYVEPFLNAECIQMIQHAYDKGHGIALYTTAVGLTLDHVSVLETMQFIKFMVHLPDDGKHMRVKVDEAYLAVIERLSKSSISNLLYIDYYGIHPKVKKLINEEKLVNRRLTSRAGNVTREIVSETPHIKGPLYCGANRLEKNVLLPNGDVALCCVDYGRRHIVGNLIKQPYSALHKSEVFKQVVKKMNCKSGDVLCRNCEWAQPITLKYRVKKILSSFKFNRNSVK